MQSVATIRNLGPAMAAAFARAGIGDAAALRALGPDAAYARLIASGERAHFIAYYALVMGLQGRAWNDCKGAEKAALRVRFDAIRSATAVGLDAVLDEIGVIPAQTLRKRKGPGALPPDPQDI